MPTQVGSPAPAFKAQAYFSQDDSFKQVGLEDYKGKWLCFWFFPMAFSSVCPTEVVGFDRACDEFKKRGCELLACSCDSYLVHKAWCQSNAELAALKYPLLSDMTKRITMDYGLLLPEKGLALRGTFLIDPDAVIRHTSVNDLPIGRSVDEVLRLLGAIQSGQPCPCNWQKGQAGCT